MTVTKDTHMRIALDSIAEVEQMKIILRGASRSGLWLSPAGEFAQELLAAMETAKRSFEAVA